MGLKISMRVEVKRYKEQWNQMFKEEAQKIEDIFDEELLDIYHIGSTSVSGLKAKPIIDMMPIVKNIKKVDSFNEKMAEIGYESLGEFGIGGRRYFRKGGDIRTHQVHVFQVTNTMDIDRHLAVRDYLRTHPEEAKRYGDLKESLAEQFPMDIESYVDGKDEFVKGLEKSALHWYKSQ